MLSRQSGDSATAADAYTQVFEYVYQECPSTNTAKRVLTLGHFSFLADQLNFALSDLSMYVLAYYLNCNHTVCKFDITEKEFTDGLRKACGPSTKLNAADNYRAAFKAVATAVRNTNATIHSDAHEMRRFYIFLYNWCLRNNQAEDRTIIASELWDFFFTDDHTKISTTAFTGYMYFANLKAWQEFVSSNDLRPSGVSFDLWERLSFFASKQSYEDYSSDNEWPIAIDTFVEWYNEKRQTKA